MSSSSTRARVWIGIAALVLIALTAWLLLRRHPAPGTPATTAASPVPRQEYVNDRIRRDIANEGLTVDRARQLFVLEVASLPGVTEPAGPIRETISGTYALTQLMAVWKELTAPQQARLRALLKHTQAAMPSAPAGQASPLPPAFSLPATAPALFIEPGGPSLARARFGDDEDDPSQDVIDEDVPPGERAYYRELYNWANSAVSELTRRPKVPYFWIEFKQINNPKFKKAWALTSAWNAGTERRLVDLSQGVPIEVCQSNVDRRKFQGFPLAVHLSVVVHEVVHCYQQFAAQSYRAAWTPKGWLQDGEATWAQMVIVPSAAFPSLQKDWSDYLGLPKTRLFARQYDAAGFFGHVQDVVESVAIVGKRLIPAFLAGAEGANESAFDVLVGDASDRIFDTWASSYFRAHEQQPLWTVKGPGSVNFPSERLAPASLAVDTGDAVQLPPADPWELSLVSLTSSADVLVIGSAQGHLAFIDSTERVNATLLPMDSIALCLRESCACPAGTLGTPPPTVKARPNIDIGLTGGRTGAAGWAVGKSLKEFCRPTPPADPEPTPANPSANDTRAPEGGQVASDPHIVTFDGRWYDLQAAGEFVLARSTVDDFDVQVRFAPLPSVRTVSVLTAVALRLGRDRLTFTVSPGTGPAAPVVRVNGRAVDARFVQLESGSVRAITTEWGSGYVVQLSDGTRVGIQPFVRHSLNAWIKPADARLGHLTGLLGDADGRPDFEPTLRNGHDVLSVSPSYDELYGAFGASWRLTPAESLFDYAAGESTASFTDLNFPDRLTPIADPGAIAAAETSCRDGGINDSNLLRNCTTDVAATGDRAYVYAYRPFQMRRSVALARAATTQPPPAKASITAPVSPSGRTVSIVLDGNVTDKSADAFANFEGFAGDIVYLNPDAACVQTRFGRLLGPGGKAIGGLSAPCGTRVTLPVAGTYRFSLNPFHDFAGPYHLPVVAVRPDRVTHIAQGEMMTGTFSMRAEHDVFVLDTKGPGTINIGGDGCVANFDAAVYFGPGEDELVGAGPACRMQALPLVKAGTYRIVLNPFNSATGTYRVPTR